VRPLEVEVLAERVEATLLRGMVRSRRPCRVALERAVHAFARTVLGVKRPKVALLNIGVEDMKGTESLREAATRLRAATLPMEFTGFIEGDKIGAGTVDVVVTDGFTGNVALKTGEGALKLMRGLLKQVFTSTVPARLGYLLARGAFAALKEKMDPRKVNGGVFLGLDGVVIKSHGGTDAIGFASAVELGYEMARHQLLAKVREMIDACPAPDVAASPV